MIKLHDPCTAEEKQRAVDDYCHEGHSIIAPSPCIIAPEKRLYLNRKYMMVGYSYKQTIEFRPVMLINAEIDGDKIKLIIEKFFTCYQYLCTIYSYCINCQCDTMIIDMDYLMEYYKAGRPIITDND